MMIISICSALSNRFDAQAEQEISHSVIDINAKRLEQVELAVKLLEKKLENLSLQVKKAELSQQA